MEQLCTTNVHLLGYHSCKDDNICISCQLLFQIGYFIKKYINPDLYTLLDNCMEIFLLFMAHLLRVKNQRIRIKEIYNTLGSNECLILMDYKMKFEPVYFRETTIEHFGKK